MEPTEPRSCLFAIKSTDNSPCSPHPRLAQYKCRSNFADQQGRRLRLLEEQREWVSVKDTNLRNIPNYKSYWHNPEHVAGTYRWSLCNNIPFMYLQNFIHLINTQNMKRKKKNLSGLSWDIPGTSANFFQKFYFLSYVWPDMNFYNMHAWKTLDQVWQKISNIGLKFNGKFVLKHQDLVIQWYSVIFKTDRTFSHTTMTT
jgi:hypothetical protein